MQKGKSKHELVSMRTARFEMESGKRLINPDRADEAPLPWLEGGAKLDEEEMFRPAIELKDSLPILTNY
jgi:hypothetical protein